MFGSLHNDFIKSLIWNAGIFHRCISKQAEEKYRICHLLQPPSQTGVILHFQMFSCLLFFSSKENKMLLKSWSVPKKPAIITCRPCASRTAHEVHYRLAFTHPPVHISPGMGGRGGEEGGKEQRAWKRWRGRIMKARGGDEKCICACWEERST